MALLSRIKKRVHGKLVESQLDWLVEACWQEGHREARSGPRQGKMMHNECAICDVISDLCKIPRR